MLSVKINSQVFCSYLSLAAFAFIALIPGLALGQVDDAQPETPPIYSTVEGTKATGLKMKTKVQLLVPESGNGPTVWLVGVCHLGEKDYYVTIDAILKSMDIVLYEGVGANGLFPDESEATNQRLVATRTAQGILVNKIYRFQQSERRLPESLEELSQATGLFDQRTLELLEIAKNDGWGNPMIYEVVDKRNARLISLGADRKEGGYHEDQDTKVDYKTSVGAKSVHLYERLANIVGVEAQPERLWMFRPNWINADASKAEMEKLVEELDDNSKRVVEAVLKNESSTLKWLVVLLEGMSSTSPKFVNYAREMLITTLSKPNKQSEQFKEILLIARNKIAMKKFVETRESNPDCKSICMIYGSAHMADFEQRICERYNYKPQHAFWLTVMQTSPEKDGKQEKSK